MSIVRSYKPTSPGIRSRKTLIHTEVTRDTPEKSLTVGLRKKAGRNNTGKIMVRHQGSGQRQLYRMIDFARQEDDVTGKVVEIEYDPNRSALIALIQYANGKRLYILLPDGLKIGDSIMSGESVEVRVGNNTKLGRMPLGTMIHNVELFPGRAARVARSAGASAQLLAKEAGWAQIRMPSGEIRRFSLDCRATVGQVGNLDHNKEVLGKAGNARHRGVRPSVRGVAMNPIDHPHGGGEGKSPVGHAGPLTPWGKPTLGYKTRKKKSQSDKYILKRIN
ncbi:MAG: 50S ribosomal protein L2 [Caldisericota bacterium]|jgi:large subunit ribosomal protein L2|nr:50S ribosomal protein L2 [Caldisericota bacterium]